MWLFSLIVFRPYFRDVFFLALESSVGCYSQKFNLLIFFPPHSLFGDFDAGSKRRLKAAAHPQVCQPVNVDMEVSDDAGSGLDGSNNMGVGLGVGVEVACELGLNFDVCMGVTP